MALIERSFIYWLQRVATFLVIASIGLGAFRFIYVATFPASVEKVDIVDDNHTIVERPLAAIGLGDTIESQREPLIPFPTLLLLSDEQVRLHPVLSPQFSELPSSLRRKISWTVFRALEDSRWEYDRDLALGEDGVASLDICGSGTFLVVCSLPPAVFTEIDGQPTPYIQRYLTGVLRDKVKALQIVVSPTSADARREPPSALKNDPEPTRVPTEEGGDVRTSSRGTETQVPEPGPTRDLSASKEGDSSISGETRSTSTEALSRPLSRPTTTVPARKKAETTEPSEERPPAGPISVGNLPEINFSYDPVELHALKPAQWEMLRKRYAIPLVLVPDQGFADDYTGLVVYLPDGSRHEMDFETLRKQYGQHKLDLSRFAPPVVESYRQAIDPVEWYQCQETRCFLLSNLIGEVVQMAIKSRNVSSGDIRQCRVEFVLGLQTRDSGVDFVIKDLRVQENDVP